MKRKSASQTAQKFSRSVILLIVSAALLCASPAIALADSCIGETNWSVPSGDWFEGNNWSGGVPGSSTSAQINGGSFTIDGAIYVGGEANGPGGTGLLTVTNSGTVTAASVYAWKSGTVTGNGTVSTTGGN